ncbi:MAG: hypothetical protein IKU13_10300 [Clostridia bacterium]|nr:hypothetical protein [Clostridia bacterium]
MNSSEIMLESLRAFIHSSTIFSFALSTVLVSAVLVFFFPQYLTDGQKKTLPKLSIVLLVYVIYIIYAIIANGGTMPRF